LERDAGSNLPPDIVIPAEPSAGVVAIAELGLVQLSELNRRTVLGDYFAVFSLGCRRSCSSLRLASAEYR
jgi:hypothetical protein